MPNGEDPDLRDQINKFERMYGGDDAIVGWMAVSNLITDLRAVLDRHDVVATDAVMELIKKRM